MRASVTFILVTVFLDAAGFGIVLPVMPKLLGALTGAGASEAARFGGFLSLTYAAAQFVASPVLGALSDAYGRRRVLLTSLLAFACDYVVLGVAPSIGWLFAGRLVAGVAGATYATAFAFVADVTDPAKRAKNFALLGAAFGFGFVVGPVIGGLLGTLGPRAPFFGAAALALVNLAYGAFVLPETLASERRRPFAWSRANPVGALVELSRFRAARLLYAVFPWQMAFFVLPSTWAYFGTVRFGWPPAVIGASLAAGGVLGILVQGVLVGPVVARIGEARAAVVGLTCGAVGQLLFAFAPTTVTMFLALVPWSLSGLVAPSYNALLSKALPRDRQGLVQGAVASQMGLAAIVSPVAMTQLFAAFSASNARPYFPGAAFVFAAALIACSGAVFALAEPRLRQAAPAV